MISMQLSLLRKNIGLRKLITRPCVDLYPPGIAPPAVETSPLTTPLHTGYFRHRAINFLRLFFNPLPRWQMSTAVRAIHALILQLELLQSRSGHCHIENNGAAIWFRQQRLLLKDL